jgi:tRNA 5-methylaminomethyl-2-thiouridine biosynthesis bifunctional protein
LDLYLGEVEAALAAWSGPADAWFLDGFAPARNPAMWSEAVLQAVGRLSAPGAAAATFTVAGTVRRGLAAAGFEVAKRPGHGAKRERLEARRPAPGPSEHPAPPPSRVVVVGGGIAGAAVVRALSREGVACVLVEAERPGAGASGNPAALVTPRLDAGLGPEAALHAQAFARAVALYRRETPEAVVAQGVLQLPVTARDPDRFARIAGWDGFAPGDLDRLASQAWAGRLDEPVDAGQPDALRFADGLVITPASVLDLWLHPAARVSGHVARVVRAEGGGWRCLDAAGAVLAEGDAVCIAAGPESGALAELAPLRAIRGQLEYTHAPVFTGEAAAWGAYAVPLADGGVVFGASHVRGDASTDVRPAEREANLRALASRRPRLAARITATTAGPPPEALRSRVSVRAATADHLPLAGQVRPGLAVLAGLGGRGFTLAPLLAEHVAAVLLGAPSPIGVTLAARCDPTRFEAMKPNLDPAVPA